MGIQEPPFKVSRASSSGSDDMAEEICGPSSNMVLERRAVLYEAEVEVLSFDFVLK